MNESAVTHYSRRQLRTQKATRGKWQETTASVALEYNKLLKDAKGRQEST